MGITLSKKQLKSLFGMNSRINILEGAVRSGKTWVSILRWISYIQTAPPGDLLMSGVSYGSLQRNVIVPMQTLVGPDMVFLSSQNKIKLWGRTIYCYGASKSDSESRIRGMTCAGGYGDELTLFPEAYFKMMMSRLSVEGAMFFGSTNPDSPHHWLKKDYLDRADKLDLTSHHYILEDNPSLPKKYVEDLKNEYTGLWYKRFALGLWVQAKGAIFDFFEEKAPYVIPCPPAKAQFYVTGIDYGTANPTVFLLFGVNMDAKPKVWLCKEYYYCARETGRQKSDIEYSEDYQEFVKGFKIRAVYPDPSARSFAIQLRRDGVRNIVKEVDNSVIDGIRTHSRMLKHGEYAILKGVAPHTIGEYAGYLWNDKKQVLGVDEPVKESDHCLDPTRYVLQTRFGSNKFNLKRMLTA